MNNSSSIARHSWSPFALLSVFLGAVFLGVVRYLLLGPSPWITALVQIAIFVGAAVGSSFLWHADSLWLPSLQKWLPAVVDPEHPHRSPLRHALLFLLLPLLGFFVLSSSQTPMGIGFLWGILMALATDAWSLWQGDTALEAAYFGEQHDTADHALHQGVVTFYLVSTAVLTLGIMVW